MLKGNEKQFELAEFELPDLLNILVCQVNW